MPSGADPQSPGRSSIPVENAAVERGWIDAPNRFFFEYKLRDGIYDPNQDEPGYGETFTDEDFHGRVYLDIDEGFQAKISTNLGTADELLPEGFEDEGEEIRYEVTDYGIEAELLDGETRMEKALEEVERLAEMLGEASKQHYLGKLERLEEA